ncbi:hypothetical protein Hbl1158_14300 [Halobaculum sp. CBA1158]|uniref:DUF7573 domain-containing protein n=1 Tax=Halobaculum sp. CBA1158 TaxID=2904243 RepID=UPI001F275FEC|nr:hypothetical protein [Halobaculum sp. CBA1158]UIO99677.1 hypothetical protein Hbl1158_14300 [Halobaculum sp. CBA1158]
MPEDRSLDEFAAETADGDDVGRGDDAGRGDDGSDAHGDSDAPVVDDADPVSPTLDVSPDGVACAACGTTVTRRWRDDGDYVCADCKSW